MVRWQWYALSEYSTQELYAIMAARMQVFIAEQASVYRDLDGHDEDAQHPVLCARTFRCALFGRTAANHAQAHRQHFYAAFGFAPASAAYDEDGILQIEMLRPPAAAPKSRISDA